MASAEHLKALLRSHLDGDHDRFMSVAMQVAAHEARLGHGKLAADLRDIVDQAKSRGGANSPVPIGRPRGDLAGLLEASHPRSRLEDMIFGKTLADRIGRVIREQRHAGRILDHGLSRGGSSCSPGSGHPEDARRFGPGGRTRSSSASRTLPHRLLADGAAQAGPPLAAPASGEAHNPCAQGLPPAASRRPRPQPPAGRPAGTQPRHPAAAARLNPRPATHLRVAGGDTRTRVSATHEPPCLPAFLR